MGIQLQNFVSLTTSGTSGAATLSNGVLNVPNYDTSGGGAWVDYSATSTIVGWSSFTTKIIKYRIIGKQLILIVSISGASNSVNTSITLPFNSINQIIAQYCYSINNGVATNGQITIGANTNLVSFSQNFTTWTSSGTKSVYSQFYVEIA